MPSWHLITEGGPGVPPARVAIPDFASSSRLLSRLMHSPAEHGPAALPSQFPPPSPEPRAGRAVCSVSRTTRAHLARRLPSWGLRSAWQQHTAALVLALRSGGHGPWAIARLVARRVRVLGQIQTAAQQLAVSRPTQQSDPTIHAFTANTAFEGCRRQVSTTLRHLSRARASALRWTQRGRTSHAQLVPPPPFAVVLPMHPELACMCALLLRSDRRKTVHECSRWA